MPASSNRVDSPATRAWLRTAPLVQALWWFIENIPTDHPHASEYFFLLRARYRNEVQDTGEK